MRTWTVHAADPRWFAARLQVSARSGPRPIGLLVAVRLGDVPAEEHARVEEVERRTAAAELLMGHAALRKLDSGPFDE
ncbi:MAG: hypothetical protein M3321_02185 [Actinomycetota bacterium]|nr:hypothetical protein [Actinomycetota bacterium]